MEISNVVFSNFSGSLATTKNQTASISCSAVHPCFNIALQNVTLAPSANGTETEAYGPCKYTAPNGVSGVICT